MVQGWLATLLTPQSLSICFPPRPPPRRLGGRSSQAVTRMQTHDCPSWWSSGLWASPSSTRTAQCLEDGAQVTETALQAGLPEHPTLRGSAWALSHRTRERASRSGALPRAGTGPREPDCPAGVPRPGTGSLSHFSMTTTPALTKGWGNKFFVEKKTFFVIFSRGSHSWAQSPSEWPRGYPAVSREGCWNQRLCRASPSPTETHSHRLR